MIAIEATGIWPTRALWFALALLAASPASDALGDRSEVVRIVAMAGLWAGWAVGLAALLVPRSSALTAVRILVPGGLAAVLALLVAGAELSPLSVASVAVATLATVTVFTPWVGEAFIDGSSYGKEHRLALRPPPLFSLVVAPILWLAMAALIGIAPLLLAAKQWVVGALCLIGAVAVAPLGFRALHQLTRRWVVLVPTGMVIHDPLTMPEPQLFLRSSVLRLGPAPADSAAFDLTGGAAGLALQLELTEPVELLVRTKGRDAATQMADAVLFTPSRPRRLLDAAAKRRLPIG